MMRHSTYGALYEHIEKRIPSPWLSDGKFTHTRTFAKVHHLNFFMLRHKLEGMGATCDLDVIEKVRPRMPGTSVLVTMECRGY